MKLTRLMVTMLVVLTCTGCTSFQHSLKEGETIPDGTVLLVGAVALDPPVEQGTFVNYDVLGASRGVIRFGVTKDLSKKVDLQAFPPMSFDEALLMEMKGFSFFPQEPGTWYLRVGILDQSSHFSIPVVINGTPRFRGIDVKSLYLIKDVKIDIPPGAKAIYIGTLVYRHDGSRALNVKVRDDFKRAVQALTEEHIPGVTGRDLVKKLAQVVNQ